MCERLAELTPYRGPFSIEGFIDGYRISKAQASRDIMPNKHLRPPSQRYLELMGADLDAVPYA